MVKAILVSSVVGSFARYYLFSNFKGWALGRCYFARRSSGKRLAYIVGIPLSIGAFVFALLAVMLIGAIKSNTKIKEDAVMGIVFTMLFALGLILISRTTSTVDLMHVLFGYVLGISNSAAWYTIGTSALVAIIIIAFRRTLLLFCFDPIHSQSIGISVRAIHYFLLILLAITITVSLQTVGIILVIAMLITPGSTAFLITKRFSNMLIIASSVSVVSSILSLCQLLRDVSTGGSIVFVQGCIFLGHLYIL